MSSEHDEQVEVIPSPTSEDVDVAIHELAKILFEKWAAERSLPERIIKN